MLNNATSEMLDMSHVLKRKIDNYDVLGQFETKSKCSVVVLELNMNVVIHV